MLTRSTPIPSTAQRAIFPLGGIGTGNVSVGPRGELTDWEFENHPDKGRRNPYSFFAIHARPAGGEPVTRVLESGFTGPVDWEEGRGFTGLAGLPRLESSTMVGEYPFVEIEFEDATLPVHAKLTAFTPLIPLDASDSGIPGAVLRYSITNPQSVPVTVTVAGTMSHTAGRGDGGYGPWQSWDVRQHVEWREHGATRGLAFDVDLPHDDLRYGTLALTTTDPSTTQKPRWLVNFWNDSVQLFWNDFTDDGLLDVEEQLTTERQPSDLQAGTGEESEEQLLARLPKLRTGSLGIVHELAPGETRDFDFVLAWSFPNRPKGWAGHVVDNENITETARNFYATRWPDAWAAAEYLGTELPAPRGADPGVPRRAVRHHARSCGGGCRERHPRDPPQHHVLPHRGRLVPGLGGILRARRIVRGHLHPRLELRAVRRVAVPRARAQRAPHRVPPRDG